MYNDNPIVVFSQQGELSDRICRIAAEYGFSKVIFSDGSDSDNLIGSTKYQVIINAPLEKEFGLDLAVNASKQGCGVIIAVAGKVSNDVAAKLGNRDIFVLPKPFSDAVLFQVLRFVTLSKSNSNVLKSENEQLEAKIRDIKLIDRAKCVLVQYLRISEKDAHRQIQKRAMDMHTTQTEIAKDIIKTYEI
ncbi:MAG: ANTAR domain-containing protein [Oscillospiraceae bacterium]|nr:ANTAR domain-containing protein [Oscillospiraceae bacterium]